MIKPKSLTQSALLAIVKNYVKRERLKARLNEAIFWETHHTWTRVEKLQAKLKRIDDEV